MTTALKRKAMHSYSLSPEDASDRDKKLIGIKRWRNFPLIDYRLKKQGQNTDKKIYLLRLNTLWTTLSIQINVGEKRKTETLKV